MTFKDYLNELKKNTPYDFSEYSDNSIYRRILKIQQDHQLTLEELAEKTRKNSHFVEQLVEEITVNTTELFRDPELWVHLYREVLPQFKKNKTITIWHAGCSSGQEVYSAMILLEELGLLERSRILATDINSKVIQHAQRGAYSISLNPSNRNNFDVVGRSLWPDSLDRFDRYFDWDTAADRMVVKEYYRKIPQFIRHDLVTDTSPFAYKVDLLFCRNVLIYFNHSLQNKVVQLFHQQMHQGGCLVLGQHEALPAFFKTKFNKTGLVYGKSSFFHFNT